MKRAKSMNSGASSLHVWEDQRLSDSSFPAAVQLQKCHRTQNSTRMTGVLQAYLRSSLGSDEEVDSSEISKSASVFARCSKSVQGAMFSMFLFNVQIVQGAMFLMFLLNVRIVQGAALFRWVKAGVGEPQRLCKFHTGGATASAHVVSIKYEICTKWPNAGLAEIKKHTKMLKECLKAESYLPKR